MRTKALLGLAALAASAATCVAQSNVYSMNIVGYVNVDVAQGWNLLANPLKPSNANNSITNLITLPDTADTAELYTWTGTGWSAPSIWTEGFGWYTTDAGGNEIAAPDVEVGDAFFLKSPVATKVTFVGEVTEGNISTTFQPGINMVANKVPVQERWPGVDVGNDGDQILPFRNGGWAPAIIYTEGFGWGEDEATVAGPELRVGEGVAYRNTGTALTWNRTFDP
jgi:hypothetical protein